uniref:Uncharacterized protein n=1 Tax=Arundo donax TaxID=35708 RepID=A0A0A9E0P3_ARUDO
MEGPMAVVRRVHARLLRAPRQGQGPGHHLRQGRLSRALLRRRRPVLPRQPSHHPRPPPPSHPLRFLSGLPSHRFLPQEAFQTDRNRAFFPDWWLPRRTGHGPHLGCRPIQIPSSLGSIATSLGSYEYD